MNLGSGGSAVGSVTNVMDLNASPIDHSGCRSKKIVVFSHNSRAVLVLVKTGYLMLVDRSVKMSQ